MAANTLCFFPVTAAIPTVTAYATFDTLTNTADTPDSVIPVLAFDPTADEFALFQGFLPSIYAGGGVTVTIGWSVAATPGQNVIWNAAFKSITATTDDIDSKTFAAVQASAATASPATQGYIAYTEIAFTNGAQMDSVAAGEMFWLAISRQATSASDTMTANDALLHFVAIRETA